MTLTVVPSKNPIPNQLAYITNVKYSPAYPKVNDLITAYVTVTNNFTTNQTAPFKVNVQGTTVTVPSLAAGAQTTVTVPNAFSFSYPGTQTLVNTLIDNQGNDFGAYTNTLTFTSTTQTTPANIQALQQQLVQLITLLIKLLQQASSQGLISSTQLNSALNSISH
jgi:hypothetical protein